MTRPLRHALVAAALVALLAACSSVTRVAYNNAVFAATWVVDDWFDLHDGQRDWVKGRLGRLLAWHRANELPAYERLLQDTAARAATRIDADDARRIYREMRDLYHRTLRQAIPDVADFLLQVHPEQVAHLERKFAEDNARVVKESVKDTREERLEARARRYLERVEDWTGRLSAAQRDQVRARVVAIEDTTEERLGDRRFRQSETIALIRAKPSREALIAALTASGLPTGTFHFAGFLPHKSGQRRQALTGLRALPGTLVLYESPHRLERLLGELAEILPERDVVLARELTKKFEEFLRGKPAALLARAQQRVLKGEFVVLVGAAPQEAPPQALTDDPAAA